MDELSSKSSFTYEDLLQCAHGNLFGPGNARLPLPPMLMFDRIVKISDDGGEHGQGEIIAELDVDEDLWFYQCHFEGDPVMPGCLGLDALWQMLGFFLGWLKRPGPGRALSVGEVKFSGEVKPGVTLPSLILVLIVEDGFHLKVVECPIERGSHHVRLVFLTTTTVAELIEQRVGGGDLGRNIVDPPRAIKYAIDRWQR